MTLYIIIICAIGIIICLNPFRPQPGYYGRSKTILMRQNGHYRQVEPYVPTYRHKI